jgi:hypothetical protein
LNIIPVDHHHNLFKLFTAICAVTLVCVVWHDNNSPLIWCSNLNVIRPLLFFGFLCGPRLLILYIQVTTTTILDHTAQAHTSRWLPFSPHFINTVTLITDIQIRFHTLDLIHPNFYFFRDIITRKHAILGTL